MKIKPVYRFGRDGLRQNWRNHSRRLEILEKLSKNQYIKKTSSNSIINPLFEYHSLLTCALCWCICNYVNKNSFITYRRLQRWKGGFKLWRNQPEWLMFDLQLFVGLYDCRHNIHIDWVECVVKEASVVSRYIVHCLLQTAPWKIGQEACVWHLPIVCYLHKHCVFAFS